MAARSRDPFGVAARDFADWLETGGQAPDADPQVARMLLEFMRDYLELGDPGELRSGDLRELLLDVYPRKVTVLHPQDASDVVPTARALVGFLAGSGRVRSPAALREELNELEPGFLDAVMDPPRWGMARSFTQAMAADGVDFSDETAVNAWLAGHNAWQPGPKDGGELFGDTDLDPVGLREAFGLGDRLPGLRLPDEAALAQAARRSAVMAQARKLAEWAGERGSTLTDQGELEPTDVVEAARLLSLDVPAGTAGIPALRQVWHLARCLWFVDEDEEGQAFTTDQAAQWPDGDDGEVLQLWSSALGHLASHSLAVDDEDGAFGDLLLGGAADGLLMLLFLAGTRARRVTTAAS